MQVLHTHHQVVGGQLGIRYIGSDGKVDCSIYEVICRGRFYSKLIIISPLRRPVSSKIKVHPLLYLWTGVNLALHMIFDSEMETMYRVKLCSIAAHYRVELCMYGDTEWHTKVPLVPSLCSNARMALKDRHDDGEQPAKKRPIQHS